VPSIVSARLPSLSINHIKRLPVTWQSYQANSPYYRKATFEKDKQPSSQAVGVELHPTFLSQLIMSAMQQTPPMQIGNALTPVAQADRSLDQVSHVHWHLLNLGAVELLNFSHHAHIIGSNEVDSNTLSSKSATTTDTMNVVLSVGGQIVVDDQ